MEFYDSFWSLAENGRLQEGLKFLEDQVSHLDAIERKRFLKILERNILDSKIFSEEEYNHLSLFFIKIGSYVAAGNCLDKINWKNSWPAIKTKIELSTLMGKVYERKKSISFAINYLKENKSIPLLENFREEKMAAPILALLTGDEAGLIESFNSLDEKQLLVDMDYWTQKKGVIKKFIITSGSKLVSDGVKGNQGLRKIYIKALYNFILNFGMDGECLLSQEAYFAKFGEPGETDLGEVDFAEDLFENSEDRSRDEIRLSFLIKEEKFTDALLLMGRIREKDPENKLLERTSEIYEMIYRKESKLNHQFTYPPMVIEASQEEEGSLYASIKSLPVDSLKRGIVDYLVVLFMAGEYSYGMRLWNFFQELGIEDLGADYVYVSLLMGKKNYLKAVDFCKDVITKSADDPHTHKSFLYLRGEAYYHLGMKRSALRDFYTIRQADPKYRDIETKVELVEKSK